MILADPKKMSFPFRCVSRVSGCAICVKANDVSARVEQASSLYSVLTIILPEYGLATFSVQTLEASVFVEARAGEPDSILDPRSC